MEENRRHIIIGRSLTQELQSTVASVPVCNQHAAPTPQQPPDVIKITLVDVRHRSGNAKLPPIGEICRSTQGPAQEPGGHGSFDDDRSATASENVERSWHAGGFNLMCKQSRR